MRELQTRLHRLLGYGCKRGMEFATAEFISPVIILTTTVKIDGQDNDLLRAFGESLCRRTRFFECMEIIRKASVKVPVNQHDVIVADICGTGVDII